VRIPVGSEDVATFTRLSKPTSVLREVPRPPDDQSSNIRSRRRTYGNNSKPYLRSHGTDSRLTVISFAGFRGGTLYSNSLVFWLF
jgi:hypothetical protein